MLKKIIILILALALIIGGILLFFYRPGGGEETIGEDVTVGDFFPAGSGTNTETGSNTSGSDTSTNTGGVSSPILRLVKIYKDPTSGAGVSTSKTGDVIRFIDKVTGHIFETPTTALSLTKISNTTIPKIYESVWTENAQGVIIRYLKDDNQTIESFYAKLKSTGTTGTEDGSNPQTLEGTFLPQNISSLVTSPQKTQIFYTNSTVEGSLGTQANPDGTKRTELFKSPLREWNVTWPSTNIITLTTKPSANIQGILYFFNKTSSSLEKILTRQGLTTLTSGDASRILISENIGGFISTSLFNVKTKQTEPFPIQTLAEKCVWSNTEKDIVYCAAPADGGLFGNLPDDWYQGLTSFTDEIWKIDLGTGSTERLANPSETAREDVDAYNLIVTPKDDLLIFSNKKDDSLWAVRLAPTLEN